MSQALAVMVVDDEPLALARLQTLLAECTQPRCEVTAVASDAMQALALARTHRMDLALLDIHMPGADGLQLARELQQLQPNLSIVFVTAHGEHALKAFDLDVTDYLTKPVLAERLQKALQRALQKILLSRPREPGLGGAAAPLASERYVVIQERGMTLRVPIEEVLYFKAELKYLTVRTAQRSYILDAALADLEAQYPDQLMRIHRNTLVARAQLRALELLPGSADAEGAEGVEGAAGAQQQAQHWVVRLRACDEALHVSRRLLASVRAAIAQAPRQ